MSKIALANKYRPRKLGRLDRAGIHKSYFRKSN
jgi:hypothetical protein